nr:D-glucuronyl C5-epimerase family protein [Flavobacterium sp. CYK-55]
MVYIDDFAVLQYDFIVTPYNLNPPCQSSMAQSFCIGMMIEAYSITNDKSYLQIAKKMIKSFDVLIEDGGVKSMWDGTPFYEEYPDPNSHVLNGYMFSLSGLYYAYKTTEDLEAKRLFDIGINSLKVKINQYDAAFTSYYSKLVGELPVFASAINEDPDHYHELVIYQLLTLYIWTNESIFKEYALKFLKYDTGKVTDFYNIDKFSQIIASSTIEPINFGVNKLNDELWSWGNYWSTNQFPTDLQINFSPVGNESIKTNIRAITFYAISENTLPRNFEVYVYQNNDWNKVCDAYQMTIRNRNYYKTDNFETYIETYYLPTPKNGSAVKIKFLDSRDGGFIALREINIHYDRFQEIEIIENLARQSDPFK